LVYYVNHSYHVDGGGDCDDGGDGGDKEGRGTGDSFGAVLEWESISGFGLRIISDTGLCNNGDRR